MKTVPTGDLVPGQALAVYCPRCGDWRPRGEWRRVWRHIASGAEGGRPAQVLRHLACKEIVYLVMV